MTPTVPPKDAFAQIAGDLVGMKLGLIWQGHGTALFLEFGNLSERVRKSGSVGNNLIGEISVGLEFDWRIEKDLRVACGSHADRSSWSEVFADLVGKPVSRIELISDVPELLVVLNERDRLLTCSLHEDGPEWALTDNRLTPALWVYWEDGALRCDDGQASP